MRTLNLNDLNDLLLALPIVDQLGDKVDQYKDGELRGTSGWKQRRGRMVEAGWGGEGRDAG